MLGELLGWPHASAITKFELDGGSYGFDTISTVAGELEKAYLAGVTVGRLAELVEGLDAALVRGREQTLGVGR